MDDVLEQDEGSDADDTDDDVTDDTDAEGDARRFVEDLVIRGEVVPAGTEPLPRGATHEYIEDGEGGPPRVRRRRFSLDPGQDR